MFLDVVPFVLFAVLLISVFYYLFEVFLFFFFFNLFFKFLFDIQGISTFRSFFIHLKSVVISSFLCNYSRYFLFHLYQSQSTGFYNHRNKALPLSRHFLNGFWVNSHSSVCCYNTKSRPVGASAGFLCFYIYLMYNLQLIVPLHTFSSVNSIYFVLRSLVLGGSYKRHKYSYRLLLNFNSRFSFLNLESPYYLSTLISSSTQLRLLFRSNFNLNSRVLYKNSGYTGMVRYLTIKHRALSRSRSRHRRIFNRHLFFNRFFFILCHYIYMILNIILH